MIYQFGLIAKDIKNSVTPIVYDRFSRDLGIEEHFEILNIPEDKLQEMALKAAALAAGGANDAELLTVLKQILAFLQNTPIVALDPESLRKYFIRKTNQNTKATGKPELLV